MDIYHIHSFNLSTQEIPLLQRKLAERVTLAPFTGSPGLIAGCDVSYCKKRNLLFGCVVITSYPAWKVEELCFSKKEGSFPYIPGMLSFRELPLLLQMLRKIKTVPDVILVDGQGIAHPRGLGLASHLGVFIKVPTIGVAKKCLCGEYNKEEVKAGRWVPLFYEERQVGFVTQRQENQNPLYISPGNNINLKSLPGIMQKIFAHSPYKLPHPLYLAHKFSYDFNLYSR